METLTSYDELPYDSLPLPETQPDFLAAVARLHGFDAPDPRRARILELGCAQGGNLIPLAWRWPESGCVGVELSRVQTEAGADFIRRLGLPNVRILHGDLAAPPDDLGEFDFIIAHGVFSWVSPAVRQALLDVCRRHLSPHGIAYISFNVAAGWHPLQALRTALLERTSADLPAPTRFEQALRVLGDLASEWTDPVLLKEIAYLQSAAPSYLFHEYLAEFNVPMAFGEFAALLDTHGLRYVGEAGPRRAVVEIEDARRLIPQSMAGRWLDAEAALDDALATRFRRALIARADAPCAQPPRAESLSGLAFYADLRSDEEIDLGEVIEQNFINPAGNTLPIAQPLMKAAVMALSGAYPNASTYADLLSAAHELMADHGVPENIDAAPKDADPLCAEVPQSGMASYAAFSEALFQQVITHGVTPTVSAVSFAAEPGERPAAHALARQQASTPGWVVSGARHVAMDMDAPGRILLGLLDGSRTADELAAVMRVTLAKAGVDRSPETVSELTHRQLWRFARQGLLTK